MNLTPNDLAHLSPEEKRALLVKLLQQKARESVSPSPPPQERVEFFDQFAMSVTDLDAQAVLDSSIHPDTVPVEPIPEPTHVFLTGATGFLGAFLLHELLQQTQADIYCLVRCSNLGEGQQRIQSNFESYLPSSEYQSSRIIPVAGDLSQPLLGLSAQQFATLAGKTEAIYHNGAAVNWIYSYNKLKSTNVLGTQEVLRLASHTKVKPVHFVSSLSVFPLVGNNGKVIREQDTIDHGGVLYGGYTQSKWVAEKLVTIARSKGLPIAIYRPGLIIGDSQTGAWNTDDFMSRMIKSWVELKGMPYLDGATDMTPVDYVSRAIVHLSKSKRSLGKVFHLSNPRRVHGRELISWIRSFGYPIEYMPYEQWRAKLLNLAGHSRENAVYSLMPLFSMKVPGKTPSSGSGMPTFDDQDTIDRIGRIIATQYATLSVRFDDQNTRDGLAGTSIMCPPVDAALFTRYFSYFVRTGFLQAPAPHREA
jgi:thioester reductase-like protein